MSRPPRNSGLSEGGGLRSVSPTGRVRVDTPPSSHPRPRVTPGQAEGTRETGPRRRGTGVSVQGRFPWTGPGPALRLQPVSIGTSGQTGTYIRTLSRTVCVSPTLLERRRSYTHHRPRVHWAPREVRRLPAGGRVGSTGTGHKGVPRWGVTTDHLEGGPRREGRGRRKGREETEGGRGRRETGEGRG